MEGGELSGVENRRSRKENLLLERGHLVRGGEKTPYGEKKN